MKKKCILLTLVLALVLPMLSAPALAASSFSGRADVLAANDAVTLYAPDGRTKTVWPNEVEANVKVGWYTKPVTILYAADGRTRVTYVEEVDAYLKVGWYRTRDEALYVTLYAADGRTRNTLRSEVDAYLKVGWYRTRDEALYVTLYAADGRTRKTLRSEVDAYLKVGWYRTKNEALYVTLYAADGRTRNTLRSEVDAYLKVGWYRTREDARCVTLYSDNGKTIRVAPEKLNSYLSLGWRTEPFTISASSSAESLLNSATLLPMKTGYDELDNLVDDIFKQIFTDKMTTYQKVKACYDYLIQHTAYRGTDEAADALWSKTFSKALMETGGFWSSRWDICTAYATLVSGSGVCNYYSSAFMVMTRRIGVECYIFDGLGPAPGGGYTGHAWNVITIGGVDYIFDSQIEDYNTVSGTIRYRLFCKTFKAMGANYKGYDTESCKAAFNGYGLVPIV